MQCQLEIVRFCGNTSLVYFLRTMGVAATREAAAVHDAAIARVWHEVVGTAQATPAERSRAVRQARLPVHSFADLGLNDKLLGCNLGKSIENVNMLENRTLTPIFFACSLLSRRWTTP